jgi:hypothetical protein
MMAAAEPLPAMERAVLPTAQAMAMGREPSVIRRVAGIVAGTREGMAVAGTSK